MKTSNIILIAIIGSITLLTITTAVSIRLTGETRGTTISKSTTVHLPDFNYVSVKDVKNTLNILSGSKGGLEFRVLNDAALPDFDYKVRNDTLFLSNINRGPAIIILTIPYQAEIINSKNSNIDIGNIAQQSMFFNFVKSNLTIRKNAGLKSIQINGYAESNINIYIKHLHELTLDLRDTRVTLHQATVDQLRGSMTDNSALTVREVHDFDFQKDKTSKLRHWQ